MHLEAVSAAVVVAAAVSVEGLVFVAVVTVEALVVVAVAVGADVA